MTNRTSLQFQIEQLRQEKMIYAVESVAVFILSLFLSVFLPNLLFQYVFANQQLTEAPKVLEYIPVASFVIGVGFFLFSMAGNFLRMLKVRNLEKQLAALSTDVVCCTDCEGCECSDHGSCDCGCDEVIEVTSPKSIGLLAEKMKQTSKVKKSASKRK